jgi:hypothetical protein
MPKVVVSKTTSLPPDEAFKKVQDFLERDPELKRLDPKISYSFDPKGRQGSAKGSLFSAQMKVQDQGNGCHVEIAVDLPLALMMVKGLVTKTLEKKLQEHLA